MLSDAAAREYLERMVPLQVAFTNNIDRLTEIKRDARSDGLNLDALNALLPVLSKYPHDKGASVLNDVIRYAEAFGAEPVVSQTVTPATAPSVPAADADVSPLPKAEAPASAAPRRRSSALAQLRLSTQVVAAMFLTFGLLWLLK